MTDHRDPKHGPIAPLQLDTDLRLHPQQLMLGKAALLTDAITLPFTDIDSRLNDYILGASDEEKKHLRSSMKQYLGRLNANPHIPLKFRLKVLNRFEQELDLFDAEMTAAVLNAHKVGVMLVQEAARTDKSYFPTLVDMIANAIELALKLLLIDLEQYRAPAVIVTRQFFELAKLGLETSTALGPHAQAKTARLYKAICNHEFLRRLDFFSKTPQQQQQIWQELQCHISTIHPLFYHRDEAFQHPAQQTSLFINLSRPHEPAQIIGKHTTTASFDCIIMPLDNLIARLATAIRSVNEVLKNTSSQSTALHTEDALTGTRVGGKAILLALKEEKRPCPRHRQAEHKVQLKHDLSTTMLHEFSNGSIYSDTPPADTLALWNIINFNHHGICLERLHSSALPSLLGKMIGLQWLIADHTPTSIASDMPTTPGLGIIRWVREHKPGEQRIGIEFFPPTCSTAASTPYSLAKAVVIGSNKEMEDKRTWPILIRSGQSSHTAIFPATSIYRNMTFMVLQHGASTHFKVHHISESGPNYTRCTIIPAKTR